jgi:hypothetical protein
MLLYNGHGQKDSAREYDPLYNYRKTMNNTVISALDMLKPPVRALKAICKAAT